MTFLIHGATGAQGAPVLAALLPSAPDTRAAVRDAAAYSGPGTAVSVDLSSADSLAAAYADVDGVFLHLPIGSPAQQATQAAAVVEAVRRARPGRMVLSTSGARVDVPGDDDSPFTVITRGIREAGVSLAVVEPRLYLENLLMPIVVGPAREEGVLRYPLRDGYAVSWSSHLDVADVVVRLLEDASVTGVVGIGALPALTGADLAAGFAEHLGRDVRYEPLTPDEFGERIIPLFGEAGARPVIEAYRWRATQEADAVDEATSAQTRLGLTPRSVRAWLRDIGA
ncbi:uncharacterized protein YbjT (DUF2867 family) [Clavibacter sp. B3I6]|uniref:NmrA family NAD(P)-binding protein n=1 Tax=Clavibacter sp. B3I6 TaxID=3042268 RepID=UPI0027863DE6|nr:NmrA family NAD(P)-binding protein [Clavibacter sp. B3I6]MDQ0744909.1 uncharacterized protein YbjT (DUF2867 family) [Clavibacter sp. B3I6]